MLPAKYEVALKFPLSEDDMNAFDLLIELEDHLINGLANHAEVDGHETGSGEMVIYISSEDPAGTLARALPIIEASKFRDFEVGYRSDDMQYYAPLWPTGLTRFVIV